MNAVHIKMIIIMDVNFGLEVAGQLKGLKLEKPEREKTISWSRKA